MTEFNKPIESSENNKKNTDREKFNQALEIINSPLSDLEVKKQYGITRELLIKSTNLDLI